MVYDLVSSDMGAYQCFAKSYLGTIQATAELSVFRKGNHCIYIVLKAKYFCGKGELQGPVAQSPIKLILD